MVTLANLRCLAVLRRGEAYLLTTSLLSAAFTEEAVTEVTAETVAEEMAENVTEE